MPKQLALFKQQQPSSSEIRELVRSRLRDFNLYQKARQEKRQKKNEQLREEVRRLKRRIPA